MAMQSESVLKVADAAAALTLSKRTLQRMIARGLIKSVLVSTRRRVVPSSEIDRLRTVGISNG
jgi:hypothetical protein